MAEDHDKAVLKQDARSYEAVAGAVRAFGRFRKRWAVLEGLGWFVVFAPGALLAWFLLDWAVELPVWPLLGSFVLAVALGLWAAAWKLLRPVLRRVRIEREALRIESLHGGLDNQFIGSLQLGRETAEALAAGRPLGYSAELVWSLVARTAGLLGQFDPRGLLHLRRARRWVAAGAIVAAAAVACLVLARGAVAARVARLADAYAAALDAMFPVEMHVRPGDVAVVRGRPVTLAVEVVGARRRRVVLSRSDAKTGKTVRDELTLDAQRASLTVANAQETFRYRFEYGGRGTRDYTVRVGDLPAVSAIHYELAWPAYTGQPPRTLVGRVSRLQGLAGTDVLVSFAATTELHADYCYVQWQDGTKQAISVTGRFGHFSFAIERPERASIHLTGICGPGFEMARPIGFEVTVQRDQAPSVDVLRRGRKLTMLAREAREFALGWLAEDDFGVAEVTLESRIEPVDKLLGRPVRRVSQSRRVDPPRDRVRGKFAKMFEGVNPPVEPGDRIVLTVSAKDNNTESGPRLGRSRPVEIVVVRDDLAGFTEKRFGFQGHALLAGLRRIKRATDLLVDPVKTVRTETKHEIARHALRSRVTEEAWPSGAEDAVGDYFRLLSGME